MLEQQALIELLSINEQKIDNATARKIIASYAAVFDELATVCQLVLEFSEEGSTLNEAKFLADMDALSLDLLSLDDEYEENQLTKAKTQLQIFITCFNQLEYYQRIIIYYSFLENESAGKIVQQRLHTKQSVRTFYRKKNEVSNLLVKKIKWHNTITSKAL